MALRRSKNSSGTEIGQLCKAWAKINGTGTAAIEDSFNVSSITDQGTGTYSFNFANTMSNADYSVAGTSEYMHDGNVFQIVTVVNATTSAVQVYNQQLTNVSLDGTLSIAIFGD